MYSEYTDSLARISSPDARRKAITVLCAVGLCVAGTLVLTSCSGLSEQSPAAHSTILRPKSFLQKQTNREHLVLSAELPAGTAGVAYHGKISVRRGTAPYEFSIANGGLPPGLQLDRSTGEISGLPGTVGIYQFQVSAIDSAASAGVKVSSIEIQSGSSAPDVSIRISPSTTTLASGSKTRFTSAISGTSNVSVIWTATLGTVSSTGLFTAPTVSTSTTATVTATSVADQSEKASATVTIAGPSAINPPVIASTSLPRATAGVAYSATLIVTGGKSPYSWSAPSGSLPQGLTLNSGTGIISGTTMQAGNFSFQAKVTDSALQSATKKLSLPVNVARPTGTPNGFDGPAELPRAYVQSTLVDTPAPGEKISVAAGGNFQAALNSANCGDTIELQAGAVFTGIFTLPAKSCDDQHWIVIRTTAPDSSLPPEGTRVTPCYGGVSSLPGRPALSCAVSQSILAKIVHASTASGPIVLAPGANHYRLMGLEITRAAGSGGVGALLSTKPTYTADHIVVDRVWLHGTARDETGRGIHLNGTTYFAVVDSYFSDFHCISVVGTCTDAQAIAGGSGNNTGGPYKIVNNFLEASGEGIIFGGGGATTTPADIEIRRNHFFKPLQWMTGATGFVGGPAGNPFVVKNHFELKNAQRVLLEGNVLENNWGGFSQSGYSIVLTPKNQNHYGTGICPICQVTDVTIRYSTISHTGAGISVVTGLDLPATEPALAGARFSIHDITIDDVNARRYNGPGTLMLVSNGWPTNVLHDVSINHITGFPDPNSHLLSLLDRLTDPPMYGFSFTNSIVGTGAHPVWDAGAASVGSCAAGDVPITSLSSCFSSYVFSDNALIGTPAVFPPSTWPAENYFPVAADVVFAKYNAANGGDYHVLSSSPYKGAASDGRDLGADIDAIQAAISGVN